MWWLFRKPCRRTTAPTEREIDHRIQAAEVQRAEAAEARAESVSKAERVRIRLEQNEIGKGFIAAFKNWEQA